MVVFKRLKDFDNLGSVFEKDLLKLMYFVIFPFQRHK